LEAIDLSVDTYHRRKGIATAMYQFAKELGNDIIPSTKQTPNGKAFWNGNKEKKVFENNVDPRKVKYEVVRLKDEDGGFTNTFVATADGEEIGRFEGKSKWDSGEAQKQAEQCVNKHRGAAIMKQDKENAHRYQMDKPLSQLEKEWLELDKRMIHGLQTKNLISDKEHARWEQLAPVIRKSLISGEHPAAAHRAFMRTPQNKKEQ
jgi:hypothetical protein